MEASRGLLFVNDNIPRKVRRANSDSVYLMISTFLYNDDMNIDDGEMQNKTAAIFAVRSRKPSANESLNKTTLANTNEAFDTITPDIIIAASGHIPMYRSGNEQR